MSTVRQGSNGAAVQALQVQLVKHGTSLDTDGDFGPATDSAVRSFQSAHGLGVDGVVALATSMQESTLLNIDYGDRDSLGLFQQRPSQGWGTESQIMDPVLSSKAFYGVAPHTRTRGSSTSTAGSR